MYFDIPLEPRETSIIKRHPPRRLQKLEPIDLPQAITSERLLSQREARTMHKAKQELEKNMQTPMYTSGKRQYLHKMQMLEMNRKRKEAQMELKKNLHWEARINNQNPRCHKTEKTFQGITSNDDHDLLTVLPDETLNRDLENSQNAKFLDHRARNVLCPQKIGKMDTWFPVQEDQGQLLWDSSSSDSEELGKDEKKPHTLESPMKWPRKQMDEWMTCTAHVKPFETENRTQILMPLPVLPWTHIGRQIILTSTSSCPEYTTKACLQYHFKTSLI
ncbi:uncharacterized protein CCDC198 isoform X2 [Tupaia chinensis]|nr:uncharacterized protein CCDC198 isoform X2 [Tupaia chinensis]